MIKNVRIHEYGGPELLRYEDAPLPLPVEDEVRVAVRAASVNPVDWKIRSGLARKFIELALPAVLGADIAGVVEAVGPGVTAFQPGDEVFAMLGIAGGYTESAIVKVPLLVRKPAALDFIQAASVPLAALTAWQALFDIADVHPGQRVLIHAAAGGVGSFAVQFAAWKGAEVIATASEGNHSYLRGLGATHCIDYRTQKFESEVRDVDLVLDLVGGETAPRSISVLKAGGAVVNVAGPRGAQPPDAQGRRSLDIFVQPNGAQLAEIGRLIEAGVVRTEVAAVFPLRDAAQAHVLIERNHTRGKIVLRVED